MQGLCLISICLPGAIQFHTLKELLIPIIRRQNTNYRDSISVEERLTITLRFLATGESFRSLSYQFRVGLSTTRQFVPETCEAIYNVLKDKYLKCPDTVEEWQTVADGFQAQWNFPNCIDVGCNGRISDGGVFGGCSLQGALENRTSNIPVPAPLPGSDLLVPYCIVADEAFPLKEYLMKPYPNRRLSVEQRIYNYRLSLSRVLSVCMRTIEASFADSSSVFLLRLPRVLECWLWLFSPQIVDSARGVQSVPWRKLGSSSGVMVPSGVVLCS
ncbi:hypothetical protein UPYG_G00285220 [Umbra pygmaea]|uniref:DDE Tnp4 domain-containing protein n=1 Tax=Umbra pygmaea TaxID=75934 RepID=A0ABD0W3Y4_UMBPY